MSSVSGRPCERCSRAGFRKRHEYNQPRPVLSYATSQFDERDAHAKALAATRKALLLDRGTISRQSASHSIGLRVVDLLVPDPQRCGRS
jgi:hypothetical protein